MIALLALTAAGAFGISCAGFAPWLGFSLACNHEGILYLIMLVVEAITVNQTIYPILPPTAKVRAAKLAAKNK